MQFITMYLSKSVFCRAQISQFTLRNTLSYECVEATVHCGGKANISMQEKDFLLRFLVNFSHTVLLNQI